MCLLCGLKVSKGDCLECSTYEPEEDVENNMEHLSKMGIYEAAEVICAKVNELGWADKVAEWLRSEWRG